MVASEASLPGLETAFPLCPHMPVALCTEGYDSLRTRDLWIRALPL